MDFRKLNNFVVVASELSFIRAARLLHMSQPPLSRQIQELEKEVGFTLFIRGKSSITLTHAGASFLKDVKVALKHVELLKRKAILYSEGKKRNAQHFCSWNNVNSEIRSTPSYIC